MRIKLSTIKDKIVYILVFYMLNKNLWDFFLGNFSKMFYYALLLLGAMMYIFYMKKTDKKILTSFVIYIIIVLAIGLTKSNSEQLSIGLMEYLVYPLPFFAFSWFFDERKDYSKLVKNIYKWGIVTSILAIIEFVTRKPLLPTNSTNITVYYDGSRSYRSSVFIGSPMILAVLLGATLIIGFYYYHYLRKKDI